MKTRNWQRPKLFQKVSTEKKRHELRELRGGIQHHARRHVQAGGERTSQQKKRDLQNRKNPPPVQKKKSVAREHKQKYLRRKGQINKGRSLGFRVLMRGGCSMLGRDQLRHFGRLITD